MPTARSRTRTRNSNVAGTYFYWLATPQTKTTTKVHGTQEFNDDVVGNFPHANGWSMVTNTTHIAQLDGLLFNFTTGALLKEFKGFPVGHTPSPVSTLSKFPSPTLLEKNAYAWKTLARTNISNPHVNVPTFIAELRDVPSLIRDWGGGFLKQVAKAHLSWRWGIKPMINDILKMCQFTDAVLQRIRWMEHLSKKGSIRRQVRLGGESLQTHESDIILHSEGDVIKVRRTINFTSKLWSSVKWNMTEAAWAILKDVNRTNDMLSYARRLTFGVNTHGALSTLWEITPWSWFVDWFAGIGDVIAATNNSFPLTWSDCCLMRTTTSESNYSLQTPGVWAFPRGMPFQRQIRKERWLIAPTLPVIPSSLALVELSKWSILGSLVALNPKLQKRIGLDPATRNALGFYN